MRGDCAVNMTGGLVCLLALFLVGGCSALKIQNCSSVSCDHTGSAMLNTSECYWSNKSCDWSLRDTNDTILAVVTPSVNVSVSCSSSEVHLKVLCDSPKYEIVYCYKLNKHEDEAPRPYGAPHSRARVFAYVALGVFVLLLIGLAIRCTRRQQTPDAAQNNRQSSSGA